MSVYFLFDQVNNLLLIQYAKSQPRSIISDGNRTNKKVFNMFEKRPHKSWLKTDRVFLLFDYVNLIRCIRNNWWLIEQPAN